MSQIAISIVAAFIALLIGFVFIACKEQWQAHQRRVEDLNYYRTHYLFSTQPNGVQYASCNAGKTWTKFVNGVAEGRCEDGNTPDLDEPHTLAWYRQHIKSVSGWTQKTSYRMYSVDGGLHWFFVDGDDTLIGDTTKVTDPELKSAWGWHCLGEYISKNGPIKTLNTETIGILSNAGITVTPK